MDFPKRKPNHYVFPFERHGASGKEDAFGFVQGSVIYDTDPSRPIGYWKEAWEMAKQRGGAILGGESDEPKPAKVQFDRTEKKGGTAGKQAKHSEMKAKPASLRCRCHDLRHSAVTRFLEARTPYPVVASIVGWSAASTIRVAKRYEHIGDKALRDAMDVLCREEIRMGSLKKAPKLETGRTSIIQ